MSHYFPRFNAWLDDWPLAMKGDRIVWETKARDLLSCTTEPPSGAPRDPLRGDLLISG